MAGREAWVPYSARPEWADLAPAAAAAAASDGEAAGRVAAVQYSEAHRDVKAFLRAALDQGEASERVLGLTADMIAANSADYSAWALRWDALRALGADLEGEAAFTAQVAQESAKNYQLWNHRRKLAAALGPGAAAAELQFCADALAQDSKNYHAWAHRQAVVAACGCWDRELAYVCQLLAQDVRNNSVWSQRAFVVQHTLARYASLGALLAAELAFTADALAAAPDNESAWNYLTGLFRLPGCAAHELARHEQVHLICCEALADRPSCKPALDLLAAYYLDLARLALSQGARREAAQASAHGLAAVAKAGVADPMRGAYWEHVAAQLREARAQAGEQGAARP